MAAPSYTTDLQTVNLAESTTNWSEMTGRTSGGAPALEDRAHIQNLYCISQPTGQATGKAAGLEYDYGSNITWTAGDVFLAWQYWQAPKAMDTWANGGMRFGVGSSAGNVKLWNAQGNAYGRNPYGGWSNVAIDPTYTADETVGSPVAGNYRIFCSAPNILSKVTKGNPHCADAIRYGRGELIIEYGETANYGTFAGIATQNDGTTARWGLFQAQAGGYLWKGLISLGNATNACDFRDANASITVDDAPRTYAAFNKIEVNNASSRVDWTNVVFSALGTLAKGRFEMIAAADVNIASCLFKDMDTFIFKSTASVNESTFLRCGQITAPGCTMTGTVVSQYTGDADTSALVWDVATDPNGYLDDMTFVKGTNAHHAIELGTTSPLSMTFNGLTSSGFNATDGQNDSFFHVKRTTGDVTINIIGGTGNFKYKSAGANVTVVISPVATTITVKDTADPPVAIVGARVLVTASDNTGTMPYQKTTTIVRSGSTATATCTGHALVNGKKALIKGANQKEYNGVYIVTVTGADTFTYTVSGTPDTPATGTIKTTGVVIDGDTNASGIATDTRTHALDQPIKGKARKSTASPYYKTGPISGTIDKDSGFSATIQLVSDE